MLDVFSDLRDPLEIPGEPSKCRTVLQAVSRFIDEQEGHGTSANTHEPRAYVPFLASFIAAISGKCTDEAIIEANVYLLGRLLEGNVVPVPVVRKKMADIADRMFVLLQRYSGNAGIAKYAIQCIACIVKVLNDQNTWRAAGTLPLKSLQAMLVFSLDPREDVRDQSVAGITEFILVINQSDLKRSKKTVVEATNAFFERELGLDGESVISLDTLNAVQHLSCIIEKMIDSQALEFEETAQLFSSLVRFWVLISSKTQIQNLIATPSQIYSRKSALYERIVKVAQVIFMEYSEHENLQMILEVLKAMEIPANASWNAKLARVNTMTFAPKHDRATVLELVQLNVNALLDMSAVSDGIPIEGIQQMFSNLKSLINLPGVQVSDAKSWFNLLLGVRFRNYWTMSFDLLKTFFESRKLEEFGECKELIDHVFSIYNSSNAQCLQTKISKDLMPVLRDCLGAAVSSFSSSTLLSNTSISNETCLLWLIDIIREYQNDESISQFENLLDIAITSPVVSSTSRCLTSIWNCFPSFCKSWALLVSEKKIELAVCESDMIRVFSKVTHSLSDSNSYLWISPLSRGIISICAATERSRKLFSANLSQTFDAFISHFVEKIIEYPAEIDLNWAFASISKLGSFCRDDVISRLFKQILRQLLEADAEDLNYEKFFDICNSLVPLLKDSEVIWLYKTCKLLVDAQDNNQKKAFKVLGSVLETHLSLLEKQGINPLKDLGYCYSAESGIKVADVSAKKVKLRCIRNLINSNQVISSELEKSLIFAGCGEIMHSVKEHGARTRQAAFTLMNDLFNRIGRTDRSAGISQIMNFFVAALAGTAHSQSGALICLRSVVRKYKRDISEQHISQLLQMALLLSKSEFREVIQSALSFIQTCASSLQFDFISSKLPEIIDAAMFWGKDSRNKYKQTVRVIFERLVKRFGADLIRSHLSNSTVCSNTAVVDAIAKEIRKKAREDEISEKNAAAQDHESVVSRKISGLKIRESEDRPLDLLDSVNNWDQLDDVSGEDELSDSDVEFETSKDGRMILNGLEEESENDAIESDSDEDSVTDRAESKSIAARTNITRKSVHSTATSRNNNNNNNKRKSKSRGEEENLITGSEYKATRAGGDVRLPGKPAPFAFLGFHKKLLNKRSKHQALRQYSTIHHKHQQQSSSTKKRKLK